MTTSPPPSTATSMPVSGQRGARVQTKITVDDPQLMVNLLGPGDEILKLVEASLDSDIHVRGNEITISGAPADNALAERIFAELLELIEKGETLTADAVRRTVGMLKQGTERAPGRGADAQHPVPARPHHPAQDAGPEAVRRRDRPAHHRLRHRPGRHRQDLPGHGQGGAGAAGQAGQPDHPDPAGGRGGRAARLPARHALREDRPVPAPALRRAARHARPRVDPAADAGGHDRGRAAGVHARADPQRRVHHPRRGAEHDAGADEDVPDPARASARRSSSPATSPRSTCPAARAAGCGWSGRSSTASRTCTSPG